MQYFIEIPYFSPPLYTVIRNSLNSKLLLKEMIVSTINIEMSNRKVFIG